MSKAPRRFAGVRDRALDVIGSDEFFMVAFVPGCMSKSQASLEDLTHRRNLYRKSSSRISKAAEANGKKSLTGNRLIAAAAIFILSAAGPLSALGFQQEIVSFETASRSVFIVQTTSIRQRGLRQVIIQSRGNSCKLEERLSFLAEIFCWEKGAAALD